MRMPLGSPSQQKNPSAAIYLTPMQLPWNTTAKVNCTCEDKGVAFGVWLGGEHQMKWSSFQMPAFIYINLGIPGKATLLFGQHTLPYWANIPVSESWPHSTPCDASALIHAAFLYSRKIKQELKNVDHWLLPLPAPPGSLLKSLF